MAGVSTATGFASNVSSNILSSLWNKAAQVIRDITSLPQAVTEMEDQAQRLGNVVHGINEKLAQEQKPPQTIVKAWLEKAGQVIESSRSISSEYQQGRNCVSCCPNCFSRYKISKRVGDWNVKVAQLHSEKEADFPANGEYGEVAPPTQMPIQTPKFFGNGIEAAQSEVESLLIEDMGVRVIGVCGMGGVGKTSLLQTINNSYKLCRSFNPIIWVTVSKDHNILNLQKCIAGRLNITLPDECDFEARKSALYSYLKNKNFLLILDDMWESLELQSLGVPLNDTASYKIVLSTRSTAVCDQMEVDKIISVEPLLKEVAWQLFRSRAFRNGNVPPEMEDVARKVAGECKGLPLAINVIAAAMRSYHYQHEWEHALHQMQNVMETFYDMHNEIEKNLFQRLKWSYNVLPQYVRICFLYFAAFPEDEQIHVQEIIDLWVAEGLVKGSGENYFVDTANSFLNQLSDRCLIEVVSKNLMGRIVRVKIHDVLRDLAIRIAEKEHRCYFREAGRGVSKFPTEEVVGEGCAKLSLMRNNLLSLPTTFSCSSLSVLLLNGNRSIKEVPGCFLNDLLLLRVLDLSSTGITSLPPCIGNLKHLASLQLVYTGISELPESIGDLKELQFLNLWGCGQLRCLPERISELKLLRALDISSCRSLEHLPRGISQLISLEKLISLDGSKIALEFEEEANAERKNACLKDLKTLTSLRHFSATIKSPVKEGLFGNWSKMRFLTLNYEDASGQNYLPEDMQAMKDLENLRLGNCDVERLPSWVTQFRKLTYLWLERCKDLKELPAQMPCLRLLVIELSEKLEELELGTGFPKLEHLTLMWLGSLECVEVGAVGAASGSGGLGEGASPLPPMLKTLHVSRCPKLKRLRGGWDKMNHLQQIRGEREWWDAIEWEDPNIKTLLQNKFRPRCYA